MSHLWIKNILPCLLCANILLLIIIKVLTKAKFNATKSLILVMHIQVKFYFFQAVEGRVAETKKVGVSCREMGVSCCLPIWVVKCACAEEDELNGVLNWRVTVEDLFLNRTYYQHKGRIVRAHHTYRRHQNSTHVTFQLLSYLNFRSINLVFNLSIC